MPSSTPGSPRGVGRGVGREGQQAQAGGGATGGPSRRRTFFSLASIPPQTETRRTSAGHYRHCAEGAGDQMRMGEGSRAAAGRADGGARSQRADARWRCGRDRRQRDGGERDGILLGAAAGSGDCAADVAAPAAAGRRALRVSIPWSSARRVPAASARPRRRPALQRARDDGPSPRSPGPRREGWGRRLRLATRVRSPSTRADGRPRIARCRPHAPTGRRPSPSPPQARRAARSRDVSSRRPAFRPAIGCRRPPTASGGGRAARAGRGARRESPGPPPLPRPAARPPQLAEDALQDAFVRTADRLA